MSQQLDYLAGLREAVSALNRDLAEPAVRPGIERVAAALGLPEDVALAALYRESRRNGYSIKLMIEELERQIETARRQQAGE